MPNYMIGRVESQLDKKLEHAMVSAFVHLSYIGIHHVMYTPEHLVT